MLMIHQIIRVILLVELLLLGSAEYTTLTGSKEIDETTYCNKLQRVKDSIPVSTNYLPVVEGEQLDSGVGTATDYALIGIDVVFKYTKHILSGYGSVHRKINFIKDCGFFHTILHLLKQDQPLLAWLVCKAMNVMFNEFKSSVFRMALVDELFKYNIVERVVELALSHEASLMNKELTWGPSKVNTVKEEASKSVLIVIDWSNDRQLDTLVEFGALDVACHLARTLQPPDEDKIYTALDAVSKLLSTTFHGYDPRVTPFGENALKLAKLCNASENYCRYYNCFDEHGKLKDIGLILLAFLVSFSSAAAFLWFLWTSLEPVKSEQNTNTKKEAAKESDVDASERNENQCTKCGKIVPVSGMKECSKCGVAYCSRSCQKADWPNHKQMCKLLRKVKEASCEAEAIEEIAKVSTNAKDGMISSLLMTHVGWISTDEELPPGLPENFLYIHEAMNKYASLGKKKREFGEAIYRRLYDELVENEEEWEDFFSHPENLGHIGDAVMILEILADIYEARKSLEECVLVLDVQSKTLEYLKGHCEDFEEADADDKWIQFCASSEYHYLCTRFTINEELKCYENNVPVIRDLTVYEEERGGSHMHTWKSLALVWDDATQQNLGGRSIQDISDETVLKVYLHAIEVDKKIRSECPDTYKIIDAASGNRATKKKHLQYQKHVELLSCAHCNKKETALGQHKQCQRCNQVVYCSKKCQSLHWKKQHKKECKKMK